MRRQIRTRTTSSASSSSGGSSSTRRSEPTGARSSSPRAWRKRTIGWDSRLASRAHVDQARASFARAVALNPGLFDAQYHLGVTQWLRRDPAGRPGAARGRRETAAAPCRGALLPRADAARAREAARGHRPPRNRRRRLRRRWPSPTRIWASRSASMAIWTRAETSLACAGTRAGTVRRAQRAGTHADAARRRRPGGRNLQAVGCRASG